MGKRPPSAREAESGRYVPHARCELHFVISAILGWHRNVQNPGKSAFRLSHAEKALRSWQEDTNNMRLHS
jgi:hypothetical protein